MPERLTPLLPQVPVEGIAVHIGKTGLCLGDEAKAQMLADGRVGIYAQTNCRFLGIFTVKRERYLGHIGPLAAQIITPALSEGIQLRVRIVMLTPEHLATSGPPEIHVSVWGDQRKLAPFLSLPGLWQPENTPP